MIVEIGSLEEPTMDRIERRSARHGDKKSPSGVKDLSKNSKRTLKVINCATDQEVFLEANDS